MQVFAPSSDWTIPPDYPFTQFATYAIVGPDPTVWQTWSDPLNTRYVHCVSTVNSGGFDSNVVLAVGMQALIDPLVDTDHVLRVTARWTRADPANTGTNYFVDLIVGVPGDSAPVVEQQLEATTEGVVFVEFTYLLQDFEVQAIRTASGYGNLTVRITTDSPFLSVPGDTFDISFVQFTCPDGTPHTVIELEGSGGMGVSRGSSDNGGVPVVNGGQHGEGIVFAGASSRTAGLGIFGGGSAPSTVLHVSPSGGLGISRGSSENGGVPTMPPTGPGGHPCLSTFSEGTDSGGGSGCGASLP